MITDRREVIILVENRIFSKGLIEQSDGILTYNIKQYTYLYQDNFFS